VNPTEEFEKIRQTWPDAKLRTEGGNSAVYLPGFQFESGGVSVTMDLLLYPYPHGSYVTRLFFRKQLTKGPNWGAHFVCGESWWAPSWKDVRADQPWISMLANHLKAVA
jgi:hypothetical protein